MKMTDPTQVLMHRNRVHPTDLFRRLNKLRHEELLCDLTIVVQGQKFKAHKVVMAACSNYFMSAILGGKSTASVSITDSATGNHMSVELQYVTIRGFTPLLDYAYTSELVVNATDVVDVLAAASYMQMFDVSTACSNFMRTTLKDPSDPARLPFWYNHSTNVPVDKTKKLNNSENEKSKDVSENLNSLFQAAVKLNRSEPSYSSAPLLSQPSMLFPLSSLHSFDAHLQHRPAGPFIPAAGAQHLLSHLLNKQSSTAISPSTSSAFLPPSSPLKCKESLSHSSPIRGKHTNAETETHVSGSHSDSNDITAKFSPCKSDKSNTSNSASDNDKNLLNNVEKSTTNDEAISKQQRAHDDDNLSKNLDQPSTEQQHQDNLQDFNKSTWQHWQQFYISNKANTISTASSNKVLGTNYNQSNNDAKQNSSISSLTENLNSSFRTPTAIGPHFPLSMISSLNGLTFHQQLLQRHLLAQQHQHYQQTQQHANEIEKTNSDLPAMPSNGHYSSVRRRTLQSNVPKPHQCQICGSRFTRYHNLKQHIKLHSGVKPYECDICRKRFTRNYTLRLHKMKHVGIRNFRCGTCAAAFTSLGEFRAHLRLTMHTHIPAAVDDQSMLRNIGEQSQQNFERSMVEFGMGMSSNSKSGLIAEKSRKSTSSPADNHHILHGIESTKRSSRLVSASHDLSINQPTSRNNSDQGSPPLKKRSYGETEIIRYRIHSDSSDVITTST